MRQSIDGIYLTNARLDWKLGDNTFMRVEYVGGPNTGLYGGYRPYDPFDMPMGVPTSPTSKLLGH